MAGTSEKRNVILGVTGSIAAYKSAELARLLISRGYAVRVVMTQSAQQFIGPVTLEAITGTPVYSDFWDGSEIEGIKHIELSDWGEVLVIAPATADVIAKMAAGIADTPLLAIALASKAPILVAPAMNAHMYENPVTLENIAKLRQRGLHFIEPEQGLLACGWTGTGRLADPWEIFYEVRKALTRQDLAGRKIVITTGPTREAIDPVRFISNRSSGKMGVELARDAFRRGASVTLIHGPAEIKVPRAVQCVPVISASDMYDAVIKHTYENEKRPDAVIMAAAVADYRPVTFSDKKLKKSGQKRELPLEPNRDILAELGKRRKDDHPVLIGFAVETGELDELLAEARNKLHAKKVDLIVGNFASDAFELDTNRVWLVDKSGQETQIATTYKSRVATKIMDTVVKLL